MDKDKNQMDDNWVIEAFCSGLLKTCRIIIAMMIIVAVAVNIFEYIGV